MGKRFVAWDVKWGLWVLSNRPSRPAQWMVLANTSGFQKKPSMYFSKHSGKRNGIFTRVSFLHVHFSSKSFCSVLFKGNNQQSLEELHQCDYPSLRPEWQCWSMMFRNRAQLQSYLCLGSPSQLLLKDLQSIILTAGDEGLSTINHIDFTILLRHRLAGKGKCQKALEVQKGIDKTIVNNRKHELSFQVKKNKLFLLPTHADMKVKLMLP